MTTLYAGESFTVFIKDRRIKGENMHAFSGNQVILTFTQDVIATIALGSLTVTFDPT